ncbi:hypothetical protein [Mycobacterium parmense]|uniref:Uncharacterized protein n=1 Tax=Mycobacterium parmense TaxID=185642 RepID=A0A7I7YR19_9MYCO|nr:hypothetical protein [Mycobacterium parmense]MCV7348702.1 hypothetical protein [Mycobacterium parmense]BBZ44210.1 hypothetical protein MPRM_14910 [Mycobacterium parmense]
MPFVARTDVRDPGAADGSGRAIPPLSKELIEKYLADLVDRWDTSAGSRRCGA